MAVCGGGNLCLPLRPPPHLPPPKKKKTPQHNCFRIVILYPWSVNSVHLFWFFCLRFNPVLSLFVGCSYSGWISPLVFCQEGKTFKLWSGVFLFPYFTHRSLFALSPLPFFVCLFKAVQLEGMSHLMICTSVGNLWCYIYWIPFFSNALVQWLPCLCSSVQYLDACKPWWKNWVLVVCILLDSMSDWLCCSNAH